MFLTRLAHELQSGSKLVWKHLGAFNRPPLLDYVEPGILVGNNKAFCYLNFLLTCFSNGSLGKERLSLCSSVLGCILCITLLLLSSKLSLLLFLGGFISLTDSLFLSLAFSLSSGSFCFLTFALFLSSLQFGFLCLAFSLDRKSVV